MKSLPADRWDAPLAPGKWSAAQVTEHVARFEHPFFGKIAIADYMRLQALHALHHKRTLAPRSSRGFRARRTFCRTSPAFSPSAFPGREVPVGPLAIEAHLRPAWREGLVSHHL